MNLALTFISLVWAYGSNAGLPPVNWGGSYSPCDRHGALLSREPLDLGVRISVTDARLAGAVVRALNFWTSVLEMDWHVEDGRGCAIQIVVGDRGLFARGEAARAHLPDRSGFQGWIAFNPAIELPQEEEYAVAVHELGHLFGLPHNPNSASVMFFLQVEGPVLLDDSDLKLLAARHKLRKSEWQAASGEPAH